MSDYVHISRGDNGKYKEFMSLINNSFGFNKDDEMFESLLPKLYKEEYKPVENNITLDVNDKMLAAIGLYYSTLNIMGDTLKVAGIGNVAVDPDFRKNGYMSSCLAYCLDEMKQNMTDMAFLMGKKQRYQRFSFEPAGVRYVFDLYKHNVIRKRGENKKPSFSSKPIKKDDRDILKKISEVYEKSDYKTERPLNKMYDILVSWRAFPFAAFQDDMFKGWFVLNDKMDSVDEIGYIDKNDIEEIVICALETSNQYGVKISAPPFDKPLIDYLALHAEKTTVSHSEFYTIFCYERVIKSFLKLKSTYAELADGECVLMIYGEKTPEKLKIKVKDNCPSVFETDERPNLTLNHAEAMRLLGGLYSEKRNELPPSCASWFPLPFYTYPQDSV